MGSFLLIAFAAAIDLLQAFITFTVGIIPFIGFPIAIAINVALSATLGVMLCLMLGQAGYLRKGLVIPGFFLEAIPVLSSFPFWTAMTIASIYSAKRRRRRLARTQGTVQEDPQEKGTGRLRSFGRGLLGTTPQGREARTPAAEEESEERTPEAAAGERRTAASAPLTRQVDGISPRTPPADETPGDARKRAA